MPPFLPFYYLCHFNPHKIMELLSYFYHPDHTSTWLSTGLGSSSWITDRDGIAIQHLMYLPYGEDWIDQRNASWNTPYTFSGKEKDVETGYGYFGARYYNSGLSIWLSVDPMSDKYPSMSPYNYCANNPVILVDPDGRTIVDEDDKTIANEYRTTANNRITVNKNAIAELSKNKFVKFLFKNVISDLESQNKYLEEGIKTIDKMETDKETNYHFNFVSGETSWVNKSTDGKNITINYTNKSFGWHEMVHLGDYFKNPTEWTWNKDNDLAVLPSTNVSYSLTQRYGDNYDPAWHKAENRAYQSQWSFDKSSLWSINGAFCNNLSDVRAFVIMTNRHLRDN